MAQTQDRFNMSALTKLLNKTLLEDLQLTENDIQVFIKMSLDFSQVNNSLHRLDECAGYCQGEIYQSLRAYNNMHGYVSLLICIFGTIANILNIMVLTRKEMAKTPINVILKWLAVADMFVLIEYIPFTTYQYIYNKPDEKDFSYNWAVFVLLHMHFTQILHTISIGLTVTLAVWRYVAIRYPNGTCANYLISHSREVIVFPFVIAPILCIPTYFVFKVHQSYIFGSIVPLYHVSADKDTILFRFNFWVHSVLIKLLPCCILTIISVVLMRVLCEASRRRRKLKEYGKSAQDVIELTATRSKRPPHCDRRNDRTTMLLTAVLILFLITEFPQGILGLLSGVLEKCFFARCYQPFGEVMDLLALINAAFGFVLYGLMSKQFRSTFMALFIRRHFGSTEMTRLTRVTTTCA